MKLGILVTTDRHLKHILGLTGAARAKGHDVVIFAMDDGVRLLDDKSFADLAGQDNVSMSFCSHSARDKSVETEGRPEAITVGSQLNNAMMAQAVDRLVNL